MTIPAIAPPLSPLLLAVAVIPAAAPVASGAWNATVVVGAPVEIMVKKPTLVGLMNGDTVWGFMTDEK
jgi:hypothetical protein